MGWLRATVLAVGLLHVDGAGASWVAQDRAVADRPLADDLARLRVAADPGERRKAAGELGRRLSDGRLKPDERGTAMSALIQALDDSSPLVRREVVRSLAMVGPPASETLKTLRKAARDSDAGVRVQANGALWRATSDRTAAAALRSALKDPAPTVRADAVEALGSGELASPDELPTLTPMLEDPESSVSGSAAAAINWICTRSRGKATGAVPALTKAIRHPDPIVRSRSISALAGIGPDARSALPEVIRALQDPDKSTRKSAAWAIGEIGGDDRSVIDAAVVALLDRETYVRMEAAFTLGRAGPGARRAIEALRKATRDPSVDVRVPAQLALWRVTGERERAILAMTEAVGDGSTSAGVNGIQYVAEFGASSVPILLELLSGPNAEVRFLAASALGLMEPPDERAVPPLVRALEDPAAKVRKAAAESLDVIDPRGAKRPAIKRQGEPGRGR
jgi:HEAT repeat protein